MNADDLPQGVPAGTISLLFGHPDPQMLLPPELREAILARLTAEPPED